MVDFIVAWAEKTENCVHRLVGWLGIHEAKFYDWKRRYGQVNEHNGKIPRDHWLEGWEKAAILKFHEAYPQEGYGRLAFMMLDENVVAASPSSVYRVLRDAGVLRAQDGKPSKKGTGFIQPKGPHAHWHIDVAYVNVPGTFYYLCSILDGYSRFIVHWELRGSMAEEDVQVILQRARQSVPNVKPRIISDGGPQFIAKDFKAFIRLCGMTHVRTSINYPQSNGKIERYHRTIKSESIRPGTPPTHETAKALISNYVTHYNTVRLHSAIGYVTPEAKLQGLEGEIFRVRDERLEAARERRKQNRDQARRLEKAS